MSKRLTVCFLWHMHQPYYKDDLSGQYMMPWVFLHAIKDYYELPWFASHFENIRISFNLVPSLIAQLQEYEDWKVNDLFLKTLRKECHALTASERLYLVENLFHSNHKTMVHPLPRYNELLIKKHSFSTLNSFAKSISDEELLDLQILFLLAWCGNALRQRSYLVQNLIHAGKNFTHADKISLLRELATFVAEIIPYYKKLMEEGKISVSTTPYYHPILPLLLDKASAKEADSQTVMPKYVADFSSEAEVHVQRAIKCYEDSFGKKPTGFWPAEGSVSMAALDKLVSHGVKWAATDEDILFKSAHEKFRSNLYKRHFLDTQSGSIGLLFRDKQLSDLIGFTYAGWDAKRAADDFISKLRAIYDAVSFECVVPVILDGENAWEYYSNNAMDFFFELYNALQREDWIRTATVDEVFADDSIASSKLETLRAGSWIYGTFSTWIGQNEKNRAWELLSQVKDFAAGKRDSVSAQQWAKISEELLIAEGSDWFWWYGDDHYTPLADRFDELFRKHLLNVYELLGETAPPKFYTPINKPSASAFKKHPTNYISPTVDGKISDYYEWLGAGSVDFSFEFSTMDSSGFHFGKLFYGFDEESLYFALSGDFLGFLNNDYELGIEIVGISRTLIKIPFLNQPTVAIETVGETCGLEAAFKDIFEIKVPKGCISWLAEGKIEVAFEIHKNGNLVERAPRYSMIEVNLAESFYDDWFI